MPNPNINSFSITNIKGMLDLMVNPNVISCRVYASEGTALVPGQAVKLVDTDGKLPVVSAATVNDDIFGFVNYNQKNASFAAGLPLEISAYQGNIMYMQAAAAFAPQIDLMIQSSDQTVLTAAGTGARIIGKSLDKASAVGDIVRVYINLPGAAHA
jgi:hypothetical protein